MAPNSGPTWPPGRAATARREAGITQVVAVLGDAVALDRRHDPGHVLHLEWDAHGAQVVLVALERPPEGVVLLGVDAEAVADLDGRQRARRLEQQGGEVEQPFELRRGHRAARLPVADDWSGGRPRD